MNSATLARTFTVRLPIGLPPGLRRLLEHVTAPAVPAIRQLQAGATAWIDRPLGRTVTCDAGTLWLTFDNEPMDVILEAGESHHCAKTSRLAIHALAAACIRVD